MALLAAACCALTTLPGATTPPAAAATTAKAATAATTQPTEQQVTIPVGPEPDGTPVSIDATIYTPDGSTGRHPAVLLAHGFGGSKADLADRARALTGSGYVVLAYSARGFGASGGRIHLNAPRYEIADARTLIDTLAKRPDVQLDAPGDPRVGVAGGSYGGALALMLAGADPRVDATVSAITWNDLAHAFVPGGPTGTSGTPDGVFKRRWASLFFSSSVDAALQNPRATTDVCGRFDPSVCRLFLDAARTGSVSAPLAAMMHTNSPAPTLSSLRAPTLLVQGMRDSLFGLDQSDATARALEHSGTPVAVRWFDGGHDGGEQPSDADTLTPWFERYLTDAGRARSGLPVPAFTAPVPTTGAARTVTADRYPGLDGIDAPTRLGLAPAAQGTGRILSPPGGDPAALSGAGGLGAGLGASLGGDASGGGGGGSGAASLAGYQLAALPGQSMAFDTDAVGGAAAVTGAPTVRLRVTSTARDATLFVSLWRVSASGPTSPRGLVTPVRVPTTPGQPVDVDVRLPAGTYDAAAGSRWRVLVSATDAGFAVPTDSRVYTVALADGTLTLPTAPLAATTSDSLDRETQWAGVGLAAILAAIGAFALFSARHRRRTDKRETHPEYAGVPLVVDGLVKTYKDGHRAVDDVSWRAEAGQVVGLLGPNGAGKTTTMRMLVGLIRADAGHVHVLGEPVHAGSPVLARVGALIEGPGFLPHLTGRANLHAYWQATGRDPAEADIESALKVAALGDAVDRPVRTYSQGMRQRLGIAQAMLGRPEVLLLDEPTNGLDPPQIAAMRPILHAYAQTGRTVVVSSHLLSEVEQTCTHVVVMNRGRVVTTGSIADLTGDATTLVHVEGDDAELDRLAAALRADLGEHVEHVRVDHGRHTLALTGSASRADLVAAVVAAGGRIVEVSARRRLEEVFLGVIGRPDAGRDPLGAAGGTADDSDSDDDEEARMERLRQVRAR